MAPYGNHTIHVDRGFSIIHSLDALEMSACWSLLRYSPYMVKRTSKEYAKVFVLLSCFYKPVNQV